MATASQGESLYVSVAEAARQLSVSRSTIWRLIEGNKLGAWQPGGEGARVLIPRSELSPRLPEATTDSDATVQSNSNTTIPGPAPRWMAR